MLFCYGFGLLGIVSLPVFAKILLMKKGRGRMAEKAEGRKGNYFLNINYC